MDRQQCVQLQFAFASPTVVPQGDGSFVIKPGKPRQRLSVREAAQLAGCSRDGIYRLIEAGIIEYERPTPHCIRIFADSLQEHLQTSSVRFAGNCYGAEVH